MPCLVGWNGIEIGIEINIVASIPFLTFGCEESNQKYHSIGMAIFSISPNFIPPYNGRNDHYLLLS